MKRILAFLTALCLFWVLPPAARAQGNTALVYGQEAGGTSLTLEGLEETICALQLELTLQGTCPNASFVPAVSNAYVPECRVEVREDGSTVVTVYMTAPEGVLASGSSLQLGTLLPGGDYALPAQGSLLLLDRSLQPCRGSGSVSLESRRTPPSVNPLPPSGSGSSGQTPGGGSKPEPEPETDLPTDPALPNQPDLPLPFLDVPAGYWCYDEVRYIYQAGLMNGTSATAFSPAATTTRGMIVTILYRMDGSPAAGSSAFADVAPGAYYASAVAWASANGIVTGYEDGSFGPEDPITREQMAAFLFRYARYKGMDVSAQANLSGYTDAGRISPYAVEPLRWANALGLITGTTADTISPTGSATREQAAVILTRFIRNTNQG